MHDLLSGFRYAVRQFRQSPVFTTAAVLTLALGIGGTTAIFTLIHAVMLRSLPVCDPTRLYRIGDGDDCCVEGGPQDRWGLFSFPLYERLKIETPEFEELAAFQARGGARVSVRREGVDTAASPLRSEFVTGNYFSSLGVGAFGGRMFTTDDDRPSAPPVAVLSHHLWLGTYGADVSVLGSTFVSGYLVDSSNRMAAVEFHHGSPPPTSFLYGTGSTASACSTRRWKSLPRDREVRRLNRNVNSSR